MKKPIVYLIYIFIVDVEDSQQIQEAMVTLYAR